MLEADSKAIARRARKQSWVGPAALLLLAVTVDGCSDDGGSSTPVSCPVGTTDCGGSCVDLQRDPAHCGACHAPCNADQACVAGACSDECPPGEDMCNGWCVDLQTDPRYCGDCQTACEQDEQCTAGQCLPSQTADGFTSQGPGDSDVLAALFGTREIVLTTGDGTVSNPFDTDFRVTFTPPSGAASEVTVDGFYDGDSTWRGRVYVTEAGGWSWTTHSSDDAGLDAETGSFTAVPSGFRGKMRKHPENDHQWATDDGRYFLTIADTPYLLFNDEYDESVFQNYVEDIAVRGISLVRAGLGGGYSAWDPNARQSGGRYPRPNWLHDGWDYDRFDLSQWGTTDERLAWLLNNHAGLYVDLHLMPKSDNSGEHWYQDLTAQQRERTLKYLVARVAAWPQVLFLIERDVPHTYNSWQENLQMIREIGGYLADHDPWDTFRTGNEKSREYNQLTEPSDFDDWQSFLEVQSWGYPHGRAVDYYYENISYLPVHVYHGEDKYEQTWQGVPAHPAYYYRRLFWSNLLSGGSGTYGSKYKDLIPYDQTGSTDYYYEDSDQTDSTQLTGLDETIHIVEFVEQYDIDFADFTPDDSLARLQHAVSPEGDSGPSHVQCTHHGAARYLLYHPNAEDGETSSADITDNGEIVSQHVNSRLNASLRTDRTPGVEVDLTGAAGATFTVTWFHPTTGQSYDEGTVSGGSWQTITAPAAFEGSDAVLLLRSGN